MNSPLDGLRPGVRLRGRTPSAGAPAQSDSEPPALLALRLPLPVPRHARDRPSHTAVVDAGGPVDYAALSAWSDDLARRLATAGVGAGDRVGLLLGNGAYFAALVHAAARLGAIVVPLSTRLTAGELAWQVDDAAPHLVVVDPDRARADHVDGACDLAHHAPASDVDLIDTVDLDAPTTILYTSGTTGRPKGAVLTFGNHVWSALGSSLRLGGLPEDRWLAPLPLFHIGGLSILWRAALAGATVVVPDRFDASAIAAALAADGITLVSLVPTMLARVLDAWGDRPAPVGLRAVLVGGGPATPELIARARRHGFPVALTYGLTEASSQVATAWPVAGTAAGDGNDDVQGDSVAGTGIADADLGAPPLPFTEVRIVDANGGPLPPGGTGEIVVRGPTVMTGYWNAPEATARALAGGWLHTGDIGWLDAAGRLHVRGRRDDLIVTGGENVYPAEVEAVLDAHPAIGESCVVGVPDPEWGEVVAAAVVMAATEPAAAAAAIDDAGLAAFARRQLAGYKVPRRFVRLEALPRTASGKVRRDAVRGMFGA